MTIPVLDDEGVVVGSMPVYGDYDSQVHLWLLSGGDPSNLPTRPPRWASIDSDYLNDPN